jgi:nicotinate-nucleotide pyrophosphorylase (carboxylating)
MGLYDAVLIKDNHLVACRTRSPDLSLSTIVHLARTATQQGTTIELEVDSIEQFEQSIPGNPHIILLDNMSLEQLREAVALRRRYSRKRSPGGGDRRGSHQCRGVDSLSTSAGHRI